MTADSANDRSPVSALPCTQPLDAYEEWNDILVDAGLCLRNEPTWEDAWEDTIEPATPASPPPTASRRFTLVIATPKAPVDVMPKAKCDRLTSDVIRLQNELHTAQKRCTRLDESKRRYEKESRELSDLSNELRAQLDDARRREADLRNDLAHAREETANVKGQLTLAQKYSQDQLTLAQKHSQDLARERGSAQALAESLRLQLQKHDIALRSCSEKIREDKHTNTQLTVLSAFFQKQALRLRAELDARPENRPPTLPARPFPVVRLRSKPLTRPAGPGIPGNAWSPSEYLRQLKRQEYAQRVHMQKLHEQAETTIKRYRDELVTVAQQRNELKAEADKLYTELAAHKREGAKEVEKMKDELVAAEAQREELMDEIAVLQDEKATLIQDALHAEAAQLAAEEELERLRGTLGEPADATGRGEEAQTAEATEGSPAVDAAPEELVTLRESIDSAYAPLGAIMAERLAARGIALQRAPRRDEMVVMISEFALHLATAGAPGASAPSPPFMTTNDEHIPSAQPAESSTLAATDSPHAEMAPSAPESPLPVTNLPDVTMAEATPPTEPTDSAASSPPSTAQRAGTPDARHSSTSPHRRRSSSTAKVSLSPSKETGKPVRGATKKVDKAKAAAQLRLLAGLSSTPGPMGRSGATMATPSEAGSSASPSSEKEAEQQGPPSEPSGEALAEGLDY
ncbi:hypothetical protein FOMPIDRAFT_101345 [Fomitopsis schrenkii]|uniref:Uncharacterized protein n=1 Tax=Fomitopsis schrenkii TaxID=2126942 RepID=S8FBI4_FOMSC|nr:hypothetical protein FOMPIDRAFT_101345 [Fomitopsis schrenkii]